MATDPQTPTSAARTAALSGWALFAALLVLVGFTILVFFLITELNAKELRWTRLAWVFGSVEAIAFGAAGALFGSSIQRARAERAEEDARNKTEDAVKGRALAAQLKANDPAAPSGAGRLERLGADNDSAAAKVAAEHADWARSFFPD